MANGGVDPARPRILLFGICVFIHEQLTDSGLSPITTSVIYDIQSSPFSGSSRMKASP
jgi:hypothetical protein